MRASPAAAKSSAEFNALGLPNTTVSTWPVAWAASKTGLSAGWIATQHNQWGQNSADDHSVHVTHLGCSAMRLVDAAASTTCSAPLALAAHNYKLGAGFVAGSKEAQHSPWCWNRPASPSPVAPWMVDWRLDSFGVAHMEDAWNAKITPAKTHTAACTATMSTATVSVETEAPPSMPACIMPTHARRTRCGGG